MACPVAQGRVFVPASTKAPDSLITAIAPVRISGDAVRVLEFATGLHSPVTRRTVLKKSMSVLELFSPSLREVGVVEAANQLGLSKGTLSRWLSAMEDAGFLD